MIITAVERNPRRRQCVDVYAGGALVCEVARATATQHGLKPGRTITHDELEAVLAADRRRRALDAAVAMLARRPRSEHDVRQRLLRHGFGAALAEQIVGQLRDARLIDDAEFARAWTESRDRTSPRGRRLIVQELRAAGVNATVAHDAAATISDADAAYRLVARRARSLARLDYQSFRNRLGSYLQRRGFGWEVCRTTVERCWAELGRLRQDNDLDEAIG